MKWSYSLTDSHDAEIFDHNDEYVTTAKNSDPPSTRFDRNGILKDPDVRGAICDYVCEEIEAEDWPSKDAKETYIRTAQTVLAAGRIQER